MLGYALSTAESGNPCCAALPYFYIKCQSLLGYALSAESVIHAVCSSSILYEMS